MGRYLLGLLLVLSSVSSLAQAPESIVGTWGGQLAVGPTTLRVLFNVSQAPGGTLTGTLDSPDQGAFGIPFTSASFAGTKLVIDVSRIGGRYEGTLDDNERVITGTWSQLNNELPLVLYPTAPVALKRPQEPTGFPAYDAEDVTYTNEEAKITLAGTFTKPKGRGPFPAALLITGSGPQNRNEELAQHKPFLVLADDLTRRGIAVLRVDDRGVGESTGDFATATLEDLASDVRAGIAYLKSRKDVDSKRIGLIGHSEGGVVAPLVAARSDDIAFAVLLAPPGVPGVDVLIRQGELIRNAMGMSPAMSKLQRDIQSTMINIVRQEPDAQAAQVKLERAWAETKQQISKSADLSANEKQGFEAIDALVQSQINSINTPGMRYYLSYDPRPALTKVKAPVLAVFGALDLQVPPSQNLPPVKAALETAGNPRSKVVELPELNHLFQQAEHGTPDEYSRIEETINQAALKLVGEWIEDVVAND